MTRKAGPVMSGGVVCGTLARSGDELTAAWLDERRPPGEAIELESSRWSATSQSSRASVEG